MADLPFSEKKLRRRSGWGAEWKRGIQKVGNCGLEVKTNKQTNKYQKLTFSMKFHRTCIYSINLLSIKVDTKILILL